jgi:hypothetical protein
MSDTKYAMLYKDRIIPLTRSGTLEEAEVVACEELWDLSCEGFDRFEIVEIAAHRHYEVSDFNEWFNKKSAELKAKQKKREEALEKETYERLKKKLG